MQTAFLSFERLQKVSGPYMRQKRGTPVTVNAGQTERTVRPPCCRCYFLAQGHLVKQMHHHLLLAVNLSALIAPDSIAIMA